MIRTQIQLPEPLYREVKRVARDQDWSIAEVIRRGAEAVVRSYPATKGSGGMGTRLPTPIRARLRVEDPGLLKVEIRRDEEGVE